MNTLIPTIIISLQIGLFHSMITIYDSNFIIIETVPHPKLAETISATGFLSLIDLKKNIITWFLEDLTMGYSESLPEGGMPPTNWEVMIERRNSKVEIIEEIITVDGRFLKVKLSENWGGTTCSHIHEEFYLLYDKKGTIIPSTVVPFCKLPEHSLNLPPAYEHYRYVFQQWTEFKEDNGTTSKYPVINTTIITNSLEANFSIEKLQAIPLVSKEVFQSVVNH